MVEKIKVTEESGIHKEWMERAKKISSTKELADFVDELLNKYSHDYGTICHAIAAAAIAGANCVEKSPQGGITGFQAGCVMWQIIGGWGSFDKGPKQMVQWYHLLYPQYDAELPRTISAEAFKEVVKEAKKILPTLGDTASITVLGRMKLIAEGILPNGMELRD